MAFSNGEIHAIFHKGFSWPIVKHISIETIIIIKRSRCLIMRPYYCYNCGKKNEHFSRKCTEPQKFTRCPSCESVARSPAGLRHHCRTPGFRSVKIEDYELPFKAFHNITMVFQNVSRLFCQENGQNFLLTKFLSIGTNIKLRRVYATNELRIDMKLKPAVNIGFGRLLSSGTMASFMFCDDQVRINHFYTIDANGNVSYNLKSKLKVDENHDLFLVAQSTDKAIVCSIDWNGKWKSQIAMSSKALVIH